MAITEKEYEEEKEYLKKTKKIIREIIDSTTVSIGKRKDNINEQKKFMWTNISDFTDEERAIALHDVDSDVNLINRSIDNVTKYQKALNSPYFAKLNFKEDDELMKIYIGMKSVPKDADFYVFDWRSPVASMFYNYEIGYAKYETPMGDVAGEILSKLQFKIENGEIVRCFKSDINIDDEYLQEILANSSSDKMKNIVSTIQKEQNEIIRNTNDKYLIVQGVAGSGKTSVALHRIAYLLYRDVNLTSNNILILSPSDVFSDYISDVLPELGEENVLKSTFSEFAETFLTPYKNIESYSEFLERIYRSKRTDELISYKMSSEFKKELDSFILQYKKNVKFKTSLTYNGICFSKDDLTDMFTNKYQKFPLKDRVDAMAEYICHQLRIPKKKYLNAIKTQLTISSGVELKFINLYNLFLNSSCFNKFENVINISKKINYEDITGLLYMFFEINGYPSYNNIRQVVIDEAQDYTNFQIHILHRIFKYASFTILGDNNQILNPYCSNKSLLDFSNIFDNYRYIELNKTYRSSEEIIDYSNKILGINNICPVRKTNNYPVIIRNVANDEISLYIKNDIKDMLEKKIGKIAIITKDVRDATKLYQKIIGENDDVDIQLISDSNTIVKNSIVIIPSYLSKGLEFDGVIVVNSINNSYDFSERNLYYVACTRAQHKLSIYNEPKKLLKRQ